jgi:NAD(P)-dependent dehydrogenase (short-subunit alcohol dehydrogenase family)
LINNAGVVPKKNIHNTDMRLWKETFSSNLHFPFFLSKLFANRLIENGESGSILNISSIHGENPARISVPMLHQKRHLTP